MKFHQSVLLISALVALPALALDSVEVLNSSGHLREESFAVSSPTPAWCWWDNDPVAPHFQATSADGYGNYGCLEAWSVHCDSDSLAFRGAWTAVESTYFSSSHYTVDLNCTVNLTADTRLHASRQITGDLNTDLHTLTITDAGGTETQVLAAGSGINEVSFVLLPGTYQIALQVGAQEFRSTDAGRDAYAGEVRLAWEAPGPVDTEPSAWGTVKALYR